MGLLDMLGAGLDDPRNIAALRMGGLISQGAVGQTRPQSLFGLLGQGAGAYSDTMRQAESDRLRKEEAEARKAEMEFRQRQYEQQFSEAQRKRAEEEAQRQQAERLRLSGQDFVDSAPTLSSMGMSHQDLMNRAIQQGLVGVPQVDAYLKANVPQPQRKPLVTNSLNPKDYTTESWRAFLDAGGDEAATGLLVARESKPLVSIENRTYQPPDPTKALELEVKYRNDYESHPVTKAYKELQRQHRIISEAIKQGTPQGDIAAATAINKILDPTSTVRESELDAYLSAGGLLDKLQSYVQAVTTGQKLTPAQRKNLQSLADEVFNASQELAAANALDTRKVIEGRSNVGLDVDRIAPGPWTFYGYKTQEDAVRDAKNTIMRNPQSRAQVIQRLESIGIVDHGLRNQ